MLWFDNDKTAALETKVVRATQYYEKKYGIKPNLCFVNPALYPEGTDPQQYMEIAGTEIRPSLIININHFWIGVNNNEVAHTIHNANFHKQG